jgi:hypothetical protein
MANNLCQHPAAPENFGKLLMMENLDNFLADFLQRRPGCCCLLLPPFCPNREAQPRTKTRHHPAKLWSSLFSPTLSSMPSWTLNHTPMLVPSRTTTEQRFHMDAFKLGNDSGSLSPGRNRRLSPSVRVAFSAGFDTDFGASRTGDSSGHGQRAGRAGD